MPFELHLKVFSHLDYCVGDRTAQSTSQSFSNTVPPSSEVWQVKEGSIYDGDTLRVVKGSEELKIRMCGLDAPEKKQELGVATTASVDRRSFSISCQMADLTCFNSLY